MTHFLAVGFVRDSLHEIQQQTSELRSLLGMNEGERQKYLRARAAAGEPTTYAQALSDHAADIQARTEELLAVLEQFESDPVVYTGPGDTASVLAMLEQLVSRNDG